MEVGKVGSFLSFRLFGFWVPRGKGVGLGGGWMDKVPSDDEHGMVWYGMVVWGCTV